MAASRNLCWRLGWTAESGTPSVPRHFTASNFAACPASFARISGVPRVPISPAVKSRIPVLYPRWAIFKSVPPQVSSTSSGCAAIANRSRCIGPPARGDCTVGETFLSVLRELVEEERRQARMFVLRECATVSDSKMMEYGKKSVESLQGRVALVTGAAKRLGRAVGLRLAEEGADVVIHHRSSGAEAASAVAEVEKAGRRGLAVAADLGKISDIKRLFAETEKQFGRLDILVNNAANFLHAEFETMSEQTWDAALDTNLKAPFFCAQAAAPLLKKSHGVIINFADVGGILGWTGYIPHCVSKAGVVMLTRILAKALAPEIRVNAIAPGTITMPGDPPEWEADFIKLAPLRRSGKPSDIADAVSYLVHAEFLTGQILVVDGGRSL